MRRNPSTIKLGPLPSEYRFRTIVRDCHYSIRKHLRFADPFLAIYLLKREFSYAEIASRETALRRLFASTAVVILFVGLAALDVEQWFWPGLVAVATVTMLQNLRRPIYVSFLDTVSNKPLRATILSINNQATSFATAMLMPLMGLAADRWGLWIIGVLCCALTLPDLMLRGWRPASPEQNS